MNRGAWKATVHGIAKSQTRLSVTQHNSKTQKLFSVKETVNKMKRQTTEWEKMLVSNISYKGINIQNIQRTCTTQHKKNPINYLKKRTDLIGDFPKKPYRWSTEI